MKSLIVCADQQFTLIEGGRTIVPNLYISVLAHTARPKVAIAIHTHYICKQKPYIPYSEAMCTNS